MSVETQPEIRPNRQQKRRGERWLKQQIQKQLGPKPGPTGMKPLPPPIPRLALTIQPTEFLSREEELFLLAALQSLQKQRGGLDLEYRTRRPEILSLVENAWFLRRSSLLGKEVPGEVLVEVDEPDPQALAEAEQAVYEESYAAQVAKLQAYEAQMQAQGVTDVKVQYPLHQFVPTWGKAHGYLWNLTQALGISVPIPEHLPPYGELPTRLRRQAARDLMKARLTDQPFVIYDLDAEPGKYGLVAALSQAFPGVRLLSVAELKRSVQESTELALLLTVFQAATCRAAVGPVGPTLTAAWAAGLPHTLTLYQGANWDWDGIHTQNSLPLDRDRFPDAELPQVLAQVAGILVARMDR